MRKHKPAKRRKFRFLLDSSFAKPSSFPKLRNKANLAHTVHDLSLSPQIEDKVIYQEAVKTNRFVLTINFKDFKKLVKKGKPGIIGIESQLTNNEIDEKVSKYILNKNPEDFLGKAISIKSNLKSVY